MVDKVESVVISKGSGKSTNSNREKSKNRSRRFSKKAEFFTSKYNLEMNTTKIEDPVLNMSRLGAMPVNLQIKMPRYQMAGKTSKMNRSK